MRIEYHRTLIADGVRNRAFHDALKSVIVPGETTVADIGAGTGLLGLIASKLGAKEVFLYETAEVAGVAAAILKRNRARNCHLFPCHSTEMDDPPRVDVVVSETLGNYALEENILETVKDARARHLKPGGILIPRRITQFVAPVIVPRIHDELSAWDDVGLGIDFEPARFMSLNNIYVRALAHRACGHGVRVRSLVGGRTRPGHSSLHRATRAPYALGAALSSFAAPDPAYSSRNSRASRAVQVNQFGRHPHCMDRDPF